MHPEERFCTGCGALAPEKRAGKSHAAYSAPDPHLDIRYRAAIAAAIFSFTLLNILSLFVPFLSNHSLLIAAIGAAIIGAVTIPFVGGLMKSDSPLLDFLERVLTTMPTRGPVKKMMDRFQDPRDR